MTDTYEPINPWDEPLPKDHIGLTRRSWKWIRQGLQRCEESAADRAKCLEWCYRIPEYTQTWIEVLQGSHRQMVRIAMETEDYFDLPADAMAWWERIIQNHPFVAIFAEERYAAMLKRRKERREDAH